MDEPPRKKSLKQTTLTSSWFLPKERKSSDSKREMDSRDPRTSFSDDLTDSQLLAAVDADKANETETLSVESDSQMERESFFVPLSDLKRMPACCPSLPQLKLEGNHTILFKLPVKAGIPPTPFPDVYRDAWDEHHVRLPCSSQNLYPVEDTGYGQKKLKSRWDLIQTALLSNIKNPSDLQKAVLKYNSRYGGRWSFSGLFHYFSQVAGEVGRDIFFQKTLPAMARLALRLPELIKHPIPLLEQQKDHRITMTQEQISCLLANAFFCTFPRRNTQKAGSEYSSYPTINFSSLFEGGFRGQSPVQANKLSCLMNYFRRVTTKAPTGTVTFHRQSIQDFPSWDRSVSKFTKLHATVDGSIEDDGQGMLQVDFANKFVGGGVLSGGCVQEEIRFLVCPELIISRLFTEKLADNECLIVTGVERFSNYDGYSGSFQWTGNHDDQNPRDSWGRLCTQVVAIDALITSSYTSQFRPGLIRRELNKSYCGFLSTVENPSLSPAVATGNWGCGAFGGDLHLKALIQLMAATQASRDVLYITFGEKKFCKDLDEFHNFLTKSCLTVGDIWDMIRKYSSYLTSPQSKVNILRFIMENVSTSQRHRDADAKTSTSDGADSSTPEYDMGN
eukprot:m.46863 g.46863  ORF g.46863 m.46863 type:complete len:618 (+) comp33742_c0_seq2:56-1909(+)